MSKTIVLLASGTRGDVQPYLALGLGLKSVGCQVRVATHSRFRDLVENCGLVFALLEGNPSELLMQPGWESALAFQGNWGRGLRASLQFIRIARPMFESMLVSAWDSCQGADAVIAGLPATWGAHIAEALNIPCIFCLLQPLSRTSAFPSPLLPSRHSLGSTYNRLSYLIVEQAIWQPWRVMINHWRRDFLHLKPTPFRGIHHRMYSEPTPVIYGFSEQVVTRPVDWPSSHQITGYWFMLESGDYVPPGDLTYFIESGDPPVYIGFGSTGVSKSIEVFAMLKRTLQETGLRAVLTIHRDGGSGLDQDGSIFRIQEVPHTWLFPHMAALVHHGGAGTTASGLRTGVPSLVTPQYSDQFFWGQRLAELGVSPQPIPMRSLSTKELAHSLERLVNDSSLRENAQEIGRAIRAEAGVQRAVEIIQRIL